MNDANNIKVYTLAETEKILKVTRRTLYNYIKSGQLSAVKLGRAWRVTPEALTDFISRGTTPGYFEAIAPPSQSKAGRAAKRSVSEADGKI